MDGTNSTPDEVSSTPTPANDATLNDAASPSSSPATPSDPSAAAQPAAQPPAQPAQPQPAQPAAAVTAPPAIVHPVRRGGLGGIVDEIRDALAGTETSKVYQDANGDKYVKKESLTHGQQWMRIASEALHGAGAGLAAKKGAALEAGIKAGDEQVEQEKELPKKQDAEVQKQQLDKYNMVKVKHDIAAADFALTRLKVNASSEDVKFAQSQIDREKELGSADLGVYADPHALADVQHNDPNFWKNVYQNDIVTVPEIAPDGTRKGIHVFLRTQGIGNQPVKPGTQVMDFVPGKKAGGPPSLVPRTLTQPATQNQVDAWSGAAQKKYQEWLKDEAARKDTEAQTRQRTSEIGKNQAEANKFNAEADKNRAEAHALNNGPGSTVASNGAQIVEGTMDPSNLSKRSKNYDATQKEANDYSMQKYGVPFDWAKATGDYKFATNPQTVNTLNYLNSLTGEDDKSGNLAKVVQMSKELKQGKFPPINAAAQWAKISVGNPKIAAYRAALMEVDDQIAKILQGGGQGGGGTSDAKLKQAQELLNKNFNAEQIAETADGALRPLLANRKKEIIGTNRYLMQWHGVMKPRAQANPQNPPAAASTRPQAVNPTTGAHIEWDGTAWIPVQGGK